VVHQSSRYGLEPIVWLQQWVLILVVLIILDDHCQGQSGLVWQGAHWSTDRSIVCSNPSRIFWLHFWAKVFNLAAPAPIFKNWYSFIHWVYFKLRMFKSQITIFNITGLPKSAVQNWSTVFSNVSAWLHAEQNSSSSI